LHLISLSAAPSSRSPLPLCRSRCVFCLPFTRCCRRCPHPRTQFDFKYDFDESYTQQSQADYDFNESFTQPSQADGGGPADEEALASAETARAERAAKMAAAPRAA
jgi:hypothetical protein